MSFSKPLYSITYRKAERLVVLTWLAGTSSMTDEDFKDALWVFAEGAVTHHSERMIIDVREFMHRPSGEVLAWRDEVIVPMYVKAGVKKLAWIWPGETGSRMTTSGKAGYENRYFDTENQAATWLLA